MGAYTRTYSLTDGTIAYGSQVAFELDALGSSVNNIVNAQISSGAAIADSKLAQITTAGKVSGAALTSLDSIPAGAGVIPAANLPFGEEATQAEMEAASDSTKIVTPRRVTDHFGVAKATAVFTTSGGTVTERALKNVSSIGDRGVGQFTANWATAFSSKYYIVVGSCRTASSTTTAGIGSSSSESEQTTTAYQFITQYWTGGTLIDPDICGIAAFGDQ
jgi:hypothetical protein